VSEPTSLREFARRFNAGDYFEAHEVLEKPWLAAREPEKTFLKGLIHAAVCLYQYGRGNRHGARVKYLSCHRYLDPYAPEYAGVDVAGLLRQLDRYFAALMAPGSEGPVPPPAGPPPRLTLRGE